jgi:hypothetical protein
MIFEYSREGRIAIRPDGVRSFVLLCHFRQKHAQRIPFFMCHKTKSPMGSGLGIKLAYVRSYFGV